VPGYGNGGYVLAGKWTDGVGSGGGERGWCD